MDKETAKTSVEFFADNWEKPCQSREDFVLWLEANDRQGADLYRKFVNAGMAAAVYFRQRIGK